MSADTSVAARPRARRVWLTLAATAALLAAVVVTGLVTAIEPTRWDLAGLGALTYALAGGMAFVEVGTPLGLVTPSELAVPLAGAAAAAGAVALLPLIGVVWLCAVLGDSVGFVTGRLGGERAVARLRVRRPAVARHHARLASHFARHGTTTVLVARWLPYARTATPLVAGASGMPYRRFLLASVAGSGAWAAAMCALGFAAYASVASVSRWSGRIALLLVAAVLLWLAARSALRRRALRRRV